MNTKHTTCNTCHKRQYERGQTYTPGENCECDTKHIDNVEAIMKEFERRMPLITSHGLLLEARLTPTNYQKMKDWLREELTTLQATQSQQVEEAVRKITSLPVYYRSKYSCDCSRSETEVEKNTEMVELEMVLQALTPNHQD